LAPQRDPATLELATFGVTRNGDGRMSNPGYDEGAAQITGAHFSLDGGWTGT
jgi:uncharacterized protein (DUF2141 family)